MVIRGIKHLQNDTAEDHENCKVSACGLEATGTELLQSLQEQWEIEKGFISYIKCYRKITPHGRQEILLNSQEKPYQPCSSLWLAFYHVAISWGFLRMS